MKLSALILAAASAIALAACQPAVKPAPTPEPAAIETPAPAPEPVAANTIVDIAAGNPDFSTLVAAVTAAGLGETLAGAGPFTVFAPNNAAFAALPAGTVEDLLKPENKDKLVAILTYHVVPGLTKAADLPATETEVATVNGAMVKVMAGPEGAKVGDAKVVSADIEASNGVIHVIDKVILPPAK
jgi:uncharacterized surface protein with fasciclin (FAS1) repeats